MPPVFNQFTASLILDLSFNICTQCYKFSCKVLLLLYLTNFNNLYFHFILIQNIFKFILRFFFLWPMCYLETCCLNLQIFWHFSATHLLLISGIIPLWSENILCRISILLKYVKMCFVAQNVVYLGEFSMWTWIK